jgi:hypothetical protein
MSCGVDDVPQRRLARPVVQMTKVDAYRRAVIAVAASAALNSTAGLIVRQVEVASEWQIIAWRDSGSFVHLLHPRARPNIRFVSAIEWLAFVGGVVSVNRLHLLHTRTAEHHSS